MKLHNETYRDLDGNETEAPMRAVGAIIFFIVLCVVAGLLLAFEWVTK
jgi:hypothetical protein